MRQRPRTANGHLALDLFKDLADQGKFICDISSEVPALVSLVQASEMSKTVTPDADFCPASSSKPSSGY